MHFISIYYTSVLVMMNFIRYDTSVLVMMIFIRHDAETNFRTKQTHASLYGDKSLTEDQ